MSAPNPIKVTVAILNSGKTPAINIKTIYFLHTGSDPIDPAQYARHPIEGAPKEISATTVFPNVHLDLVPETGPTDALAIKNISDGKIFLYLFVQINYRDVFNVTHKTRHCAKYDPRVRAFKPCDPTYDYAN
jgi:hypothetical protein